MKALAFSFLFFVILIGLLVASAGCAGSPVNKSASPSTTQPTLSGTIEHAVPVATGAATMIATGNPSPFITGLFELGKYLIGGAAGVTVTTATRAKRRAGKQERRTDRVAAAQPPPPPPTSPASPIFPQASTYPSAVAKAA